MRATLSDVHVRLLRGVREAIAADPMLAGWMEGASGPSLVIEDFQSAPWASLTFSGMSHRLDIRLTGSGPEIEAGRDRLSALFREPDLALPGHFLADLELRTWEEETGRDGRIGLAVQLDALTIEE